MTARPDEDHNANASGSDTGTCSASATEYAFPVTGGGSGNSRRTPSTAEATKAASARYGLTSAPGTRHSTRSDGPCPTSRSAQVRLSGPHATAVGAKLPATYRLYEFTVGANISVMSRSPACIPAIADAPAADSP